MDYEDIDMSDVISFEKCFNDEEEKQEGCTCNSGCMSCLDISWRDFV